MIEGDIQAVLAPRRRRVLALSSPRADAEAAEIKCLICNFCNTEAERKKLEDSLQK